MASRPPPPSLEALGLSTALLRPIVGALRSAGYPCHEIELPAQDDDSISFVPGELADSFLESAAVALGDEAIGITLAERLPIGSLGMLDYALCMSATMREALQRVERFYAYATQRARMELSVRDVRATVAWTRMPGARQSRHWVEFAPAIVAQRMRQTLPVEPGFLDVAFAHAPPADAGAHQRHFAGTVRFDAGRDAMAFDAALLELPLQTASSSFAALLDARMKEVTPAVDVDPFLVKVRAAILRRLEARETSLAAAAEELSCKHRTLQRALQVRGTSHARLLDESRRSRAMRLLEEGQLSLTDVATDLGFSEPSAFFRAFRRWTGTSPTLARQSQSQPQPQCSRE